MMKKFTASLMAIAGLAMIATSCSSDIATEEKEKTSNDGKVAMTFTASQETGVSRATINGSNIEWQTSDVITVWDGTAKNTFTVSPNLNDKTTANISGTVTADSKSFTAVYPNSIGQNCTFSNNTISGLVIPSTQKAVANSFDTSAIIMVAAAKNGNLTFKNIFSFFKLTTTVAYAKIVVSVEDGALAGTFTCTDYATTPVLQATTASKQITLIPSSGSTIAAGTYYIAIASGNVSGLKVQCYEKDYLWSEKAKAGSITFARSAMYDLGSTRLWDGYAIATINSSNVAVPWTRLKDNGPRFAKYDAGSSAEGSYGGVYEFSEAAKTGSNFIWGSHWRSPTINELYDLCQVSHTSDETRFVISPKTGDYSDKRLILPGNGESYWSSNATTSSVQGTTGQFLYMYLTHSYGGIQGVTVPMMYTCDGVLVDGSTGHAYGPITKGRIRPIVVE